MVKIGSSMSKEIHVPSGVTQGSHCGPILFSLFLIDLGFFIPNQSKFLMFADDIKFFRPVNSLRDALLLQEDISFFSHWCKLNKMDLNVKKCQQISFGRKQNPIVFQYQINNNNLEVSSEIKDLGILLDHKLTFNSHIEAITSRALKILGFVSRQSYEFSIPTFKLLYCSLVRSILE